MASSQCCRPVCEQQQACNKSNHQQQSQNHHQSLSQKVADMTSRVFHRDGAHGQTATTTTTHSTNESSSIVKTTAHFVRNAATNGHGATTGANHAKPATTAANGGCATTCQGRKSGRGGRGDQHKKRGLLERINDRIAGRSDDSSSSESDSDDDNKSKNRCGSPKKA